MDAVIGSLGSTPGAYLAKLAAGGWPNTSGHGDWAQLKPSRMAEAREYDESFTLTLAYLAANSTSRIHSTQLAAAVQVANPACGFAISETAAISAALSTTGGFVGVPGTTRALVEREGDGDQVWADVGGVWLTRP